MKLFNKAVRTGCLVTCFLALASIASVMAADATTQETSNYQSSFNDYKSLTDDSLADWKTLNAQSNGSGHSMQGMQHQMSPEQMANMPSEKQAPADKSMSGMEGMDHNGMQGMDHSQMKHDHAMASMEGMDHSKMAGMRQDDMKAMPSNAAPAMQPMDHAQMQEMGHDKMPSHDHSKSTMGAMPDSNSGELQHNHDEAMSDEMAPHEHAAEHGSEQGHEHSEMKMPLNQPTITTASASHWQIIPNLHPMVVHFPIALTLIAFLLSLAAYVRRTHPVSAQLAAAGHFTLWLGAIGAATAVFFGWLAYNSVNHDDAGHAAMLLHRAWAVPTAIGLILLASWDAWKHRVNELMSVPAIILLFVLSETIAVTGWLGGEVVYRHGIGVLSLPVSEGAGHSHHHHDHDGTAATANAHSTTEGATDEHPEHHHDDEKGESHEH